MRWTKSSRRWNRPLTAPSSPATRPDGPGGFGRRAFLRRGTGLTAAVAMPALLTGCFGAATPPAPSIARTPIDALFANLAQLEAGQADRPVRLLQVGDSHTAGDRFSGQMRARLQTRFGDAGRGMLPPGVPHDYYSPTDVSAAMEPAWQVHRAWSRDRTGLFGLSGFRAETAQGGAAMTLGVEGAGADTLYLETVDRPGAGSLILAADGREVARLSTDGAGPRAVNRRVDLPAGTRAIRVTAAGDGPVALLSWTVERATDGVVYDSLGTVGARVTLLDRIDAAAMADRFSARPIDALVVAFGTNEGFDDTLDAQAYAADYAQAVDRLARAAGGVPVIVVGPPDGARLPRSCADGSDARDRIACRPLSAAETANYSSLFSDPAPGSAACVWHAPPKLDAVRRAQADIAQSRGWLFWDWSAVMGSPCGIAQWALADEPLAWGDRIHLRSQGYALSADRLFNEVMSAYALWRPTA